MRFLSVLLAITCLTLSLPARAALTITFWSHELGGEFPHAFFTLSGTIDANGVPVDANYGFTAKSVSPALLFGTVPGRLDIADRRYIESSDAQFSLVLTDAQYADILQLISAWDEKTGDAHYNLNRRNCVHFIKEAARRLGLTDLDHPKLMKRPRSYLDAVEAANAGRIVPIDLRGKEYYRRLEGGTAMPTMSRPDMAQPRSTPPH